MSGGQTTVAVDGTDTDARCGTNTDAAARERALDVRHSFIVQAPAGSGKTELLIQRYLALLRTVEQPEQVVAITFTRKAAAEMRGRVLQALRDAAEETAGDAAPGAAHRLRTLAIARGVLERDRRLRWSLMLEPQRLRIDTLDAMNAWLAQQLPILSGGVADAEPTEDAAPLYRLAAERLIEHASGDGNVGAALRELLVRTDVSVDRLEGLLAALLPRRDQWLRHLGLGDEALLREKLTEGLAALHLDTQRELEALAGEERLRRLATLVRHAARNASRPQTRHMLAVWLDDRDPWETPATAIAGWRAVAHLLLTGEGEWRRRFTKNEGFGADAAQLKRLIVALCDELTLRPELREKLASLKFLPDFDYPQSQWLDLLSLRTILPQLAAELRVVLAERHTVDFVELSMGAEHALGQVEAPSELLLAIDRRIQHVLVDEFQDTSHSQFRLLELLTAGWTRGDGRTLFLVGDPMQSIYRFRDADMSLFLKAKQHGIGGTRLESLVLECNFRSCPEIVAWTNRLFARLFPDRDRADIGVAEFRACVPVRAPAQEQGVQLHVLRSDDDAVEIERVVGIVAQERTERPEASIAVLVQSRGHLAGLQAALRARDLPAHAVEIESLAETQIGQDLLGLTRALTHFDDKVAWLAVLHAPWCGLAWKDLHALCAERRELTVWEMLHDPEALSALDDDARLRATAVRDALSAVLSARSRTSFSRWIEHGWRTLGGAEALERAEDLERARQFFAELSTLARDGDVDDPAALERSFLQPRRQADPATGPGIEVMTMHRAKGLEFDTVVALGLARRVRGADPAALHWQERLRPDGSLALLLAPAGRDESGLTAYLQRVEQQRDLAERARLLYVATTRARERLHLIARLGSRQEAAMPGTMLALMSSELPADSRVQSADIAQPAVSGALTSLPLTRFAGGFEAAAARTQPSAVSPRAALRPEYEWAGYAAVHIGTVVHAHLQRLAAVGADRMHDVTIERQAPRIRRELEMLGVAASDLGRAQARVIEALTRVLADPRGRWLLAPHEEAASELQLTVLVDNRLEHLRLDRSFIENGTRWIVDYKTSTHEGASPEAFMDAEVERYRFQLERYATAMAHVDRRPIRLGLYFPLLSGFREWAAGG